MSNLFISLFLIFNIVEDDIIRNNNIYIFRKGSLESEWSKDIVKDNSITPSSVVRSEDTLFIDDGIPWGYYFSPQDGYFAMRFSPGTTCTLKSVIVTTYNTGPTCSILVWDNSPSNLPGTLLTIPTPFASIYNPVWQRINLVSPIIVSSDFWIGIFAHCPPYPAIDYYSDYNREADSSSGWWWHLVAESVPELMIRGIGNLAGTRRDVSTEKIFLSSGPLLPNPAIVEVSCTVRNYGNTNETNIPLSVNVYDSLGIIVFRDSTLVPYLEHLEEDTITFPNQWQCNLNGHYIISTQTNVENDCMRDNDTTLTEVFASTYPTLFYYDDGDPDINAFDSTAAKFTPPYYPCFIESVAFFVVANEESSSNYNLFARILDDDGMNNFPCTEIGKNSIHGVYNGWNIIDFTQEDIVIDSGSFFVQYIEKPFTYYMDLCGDMTPPFVHLKWGYYLGEWYYWDNAYQDPMIRTWVDYPSAVSEKKKGAVLSNSFSVNPSITKGKFKCSFSILKNGIVEISIYSLDGRKIKNLLNNHVKKGVHYFYPDISDLPHGVYFIQMKSEGFTKNKKLILIK